MSGHPICGKCGKEIQPGSLVDFVGDVDIEEARIVTDEDVIIVHVECPK